MADAIKITALLTVTVFIGCAVYFGERIVIIAAAIENAVSLVANETFATAPCYTRPNTLFGFTDTA